jgi:hypothetical protein
MEELCELCVMEECCDLCDMYDFCDVEDTDLVPSDDTRRDIIILTNAIQNKDRDVLRMLAGNCFNFVPCWLTDGVECYICISTGSPILSIKQKARYEYDILTRKRLN